MSYRQYYERYGMTEDDLKLANEAFRNVKLANQAISMLEEKDFKQRYSFDNFHGGAPPEYMVEMYRQALLAYYNEQLEMAKKEFEAL